MITTAPNATLADERTATDEGADAARDPHQIPEALRHMIEEAAYFIAQQRGFAPGHEIDDWLAAEAQVLDQLGERAG